MAAAQLGAVVRHIRNLAADQKESEQTDGALLRAFLSHKDQAAFEALLRRHGAMVLRVCLRTLGDVHDAEDALQATFLLLARQAASIRKPESLAGWLHGVACRMAKHASRAAARRQKHESRARPTQPRDPALSAAWHELQALLDEEIERLPETLRGPFVCCCLENKSCAEAAQQLGLQEGTVRTRLSRARKRLQERLTRRGVALTAVLAAAAVGTNATSAEVSRPLLGSTARAAVQIAGGQTPAGGLVSAQVMTFAEGVNRAMFLGKCKTAILLILCTTIIGVGLGLAARPGARAEPPPGARQPPQVPAREQREDEQQPRAGEPAKAGANETVTVRGRVLDPDGNPVAGAKVYLHAPGPGGKGPALHATSGADGRFAFTVARSEPDRTTMAVAEGYGCDWASAGQAEAGRDLTLHLVKDVPVSGRILDPDGQPVAGARLTVTGVSAPPGDDLAGYLATVRKGDGYGFARHWDGPLPGQPALLTTGADGRFKLTGIGRERVVHFHLEGPAIESTGIEVMTRAAEAVTAPGGRKVYGAAFDHLAAPSRPIRGVVREKGTGKPLAGVSVVIYGGNPWAKAVTDRDGRYQLLGYPKSPTYPLVVLPPDGLHFGRQVPVDDPPGLDPVTADIVLPAGITARGRVLDRAGGKPVPGVRVSYYALWENVHAVRREEYLKSPDPLSSALSGPDGSFAVAVLPGPGVLAAAAGELSAYRPALVTPSEVEDCLKRPPHRFNSPDTLGVAFTGIPNIGAPSLLNQSEYHALALINPGEDDTELARDLALLPPLTLEGTVVGPDGQPLPGATAIGLGHNWLYPEEFPLKSATFTVRGFHPGRPRQLSFYHKEKNLGAVLDLRGEPREPLTVQLQPCGSVTGRLLDKGGKPAGGMVFHAYEVHAHTFVHSIEVKAGADGRFRAEGLVPGQTYSLMRLKWNIVVDRLPEVIVKPGETKDLGDLTVTVDQP
jgi:RNA polymerase sigma factor (sigma-70 family)